MIKFMIINAIITIVALTIIICVYYRRASRSLKRLDDYAHRLGMLKMMIHCYDILKDDMLREENPEDIYNGGELVND